MIEDPKQPESEYQGHIGVGLLYGFGATCLYAIAVGLLSWLLSRLHFLNVEFILGSVLFVGAVQLLYVVPLFLYLRRADRPRTATGLVIAASIVALLNASCWGLLFKV